MITITMDGYTMHDMRDDARQVVSCPLDVGANVAGEATLTIPASHPHLADIKPLRSIFEIKRDGTVLFRGRMCGASSDIMTTREINLEGVLAFLNDSLIPPFDFPSDFLQDEDYRTAADGGNVVAFFLGWVLSQHNAQVDAFQQLKLGNVTVTDPNNYITRSAEKYASAWEIVEDKLFGSSLGGYLCIRYEADGNYVDYFDSFPYTNTQRIELETNISDMYKDTDGSETYSVILPTGKEGLNISTIADGDLGSNLTKKGLVIINETARSLFGYICRQVEWKDVTDVDNLLAKAKEELIHTGSTLANSVTISAADLHYTDADIQAFTWGKNAVVLSSQNGYSGTYPVTAISYGDVFDPTSISLTLERSSRGITAQTAADQKEALNGVKDIAQGVVEGSISKVDDDIESLRQEQIRQSTELITSCNELVATALTEYMRTGDYTELLQSMQNSIVLNSEGITNTYNLITQEYTEQNGQINEKLTELSSYFRVVYSQEDQSAAVFIGTSSSPIKAKLVNDRLSFIVGDDDTGQEVAYISSDKLYIYDAEILNSLTIGKYKIFPRSNGNTSIKWIG